MSGTGPIDYVVGVDPMSDNLAVIPLDVARADAALIRTLNSGTLGEVRRGDPAALALVEEAYSYFGTNPVLVDEDDPDSDVVPFDELPDSHPYDVVSWFGDDFYYFHFPLARLRTAEHAPQEIMEEFANRDFGVGLDYEPADWLDLGDSEAIEARLRELGHRVVHDQRLLGEYQYGDPRNRRRFNGQSRSPTFARRADGRDPHRPQP